MTAVIEGSIVGRSGGGATVAVGGAAIGATVSVAAGGGAASAEGVEVAPSDGASGSVCEGVAISLLTTAVRPALGVGLWTAGVKGVFEHAVRLNVISTLAIRSANRGARGAEARRDISGVRVGCWLIASPVLVSLFMIPGQH
jgi:hypothetical protein